MTLSPKKIDSNFTSSTTQRGMEAKDVEIANTRLDMDLSNGREFPVESSSGSLAEGTSAPTADDTGSYLQVVVQKHHPRRKHEPAAAADGAAGAGAGAGASAGAGAGPGADDTRVTSHARLPSASTPIAHTIVGVAGGAARAGGADVAGGAGSWCAGAGADADVVLLPHPLLLSYPAPHLYYAGRKAGGDAPRVLLEAAAARTVLAFNDDKDNNKHNMQVAEGKIVQKKTQLTAQTTNKAWKIFGDCDPGYSFENEPESVEVYYFEQGGSEFLATSGGGAGGARVSRVERALRRSIAPAAAALLAELLAAPRLLVALPLALLHDLQRCALTVVRGAVTGAVQTASDYALKPALALAYNAAVRPVAVFCAQVLGGLRLALAPLAGAACDAATRLLAAARLFDVRVSYHYLPPQPGTCTCQCQRHPSP